MKKSCSTEPCRKVRLHRERLARLKERYVWDQAAADRAVRFFEGNLRHWKEPHAGKPFVLSPWQADDIVGPLFGLKHPDGRRVFRRAYIQIPRKNGKSALAAGILLLILCTDGDGLECYTAATKKEQAKIVFKDCRQFILASPKLRKRLTVQEHRIIFKGRSSVLVPLSADSDKLDGLNVSAAVVDELHAHPSRDLYDVITTGTGARSQPMVLAITTSGQGREGVCWDEYEYAAGVLEGHFEDDSFFCYVAEADEGIAWTDPRAYQQANPNLGVSVSEEYLLAQLQRAMQQPSSERAYKRFHLNKWVAGTAAAWFRDPELWPSRAKKYTIEDLKGRRCYGGLDMSSTTDLTAFALAFPMDDGSVWFLVWHFCPEERILERAERDRVPYDVWRDQGWLIATEGNVVDYRAVVELVLDMKKQVKLKAVHYDDWNAVAVSTELEAGGVQMIKFIQGLKSFHPPCQDFEKRVLGGGIHHDGNPCVAWQMTHVKVEVDKSEKMRPIKDRDGRTRIDGVVAMLMALGALLREEGKDKPMDLKKIPQDFRRMLGV